MNHAPKTANATFAASLCDQWSRDGLRAAFVAPGSRSTPMALALIEHRDIEVEIFHDERSAAFAALGYALATGTPGLVLCSSGTAGAHFYAAVIEADASAVPMIVCTADRPPELWGRGAPQTINQTHLYGNTVRSFVEPGPPDDLDPSTFRSIARDLYRAATGPMPGPVHANLSFRDPLTGTADELPPHIEPAGHLAAPPVSDVVQDLRDVIMANGTAKTGVVVAGRSETQPEHVLALAKALGWPVLADHRSGCRKADTDEVVRHYDALLRSPVFAQQHAPDVVLRIGEITSSKALSQWLSAVAAGGADVLSSKPHGRHIDPEAIATYQFEETGVIAELAALATDPCDASWLASWRIADASAAEAIEDELAAFDGVSEIEVAQTALRSVPAGGALVVSSSMPVRDVEWFGENRSDIDVYANRGANGIDGVVATAIGVALTGTPTVCLIGDVAFLHDASSLTALVQRPIDLTIVITDNDGGGIFSFLPQHQLLDTELYEQLFGTPHGTDLSALIHAHNLTESPYTTPIAAPHGVRVVIASTDRAANLSLHDRIAAAVATAIDS